MTVERVAVSPLAVWASGYLASQPIPPANPAEMEVALAIYSHAIDVQLAGMRGLTKLYPDGSDWRQRAADSAPAHFSQQAFDLEGIA